MTGRVNGGEIVVGINCMKEFFKRKKEECSYVSLPWILVENIQLLNRHSGKKEVFSILLLTLIKVR